MRAQRSNNANAKAKAQEPASTDGVSSGAAFGKTVRVVPRGKHFERLVADVVLPDGRMLNHELACAGLAWWFAKYAAYDRELKSLYGGARMLGR